MSGFVPCLSILPSPQRTLWDELEETPSFFTLYGGTALALRLGHRISVDFDFFSQQPFDPDDLVQDIPYLHNAEIVRLNQNTLTCRVDRNGPVLVSFFGALTFGSLEKPDITSDNHLAIASLIDIAGSKMSVIQKRAEAKDYLDIAALLLNGIDLKEALHAAQRLYGPTFNPLVTLKALSYFGDIDVLPKETALRLRHAVKQIDWEPFQDKAP